MMTVDEFDAPRLTRAPTAHCVSMMSGATHQYCVYAVPAYYEGSKKSDFPYYLAIVDSRDNVVLTHYGFASYKRVMERAYKLCMENVERVLT